MSYAAQPTSSDRSPSGLVALYQDDSTAKFLIIFGWCLVALASLAGMLVVGTSVFTFAESTFGGTSSTEYPFGDADSWDMGGFGQTFGVIGIVWGIAIAAFGSFPGVVVIALGRGLRYLRASAHIQARIALAC